MHVIYVSLHSNGIKATDLTVNFACAEDGAVSSDEELNGGDEILQDGKQICEDRDLKDRLLRKFGSRISSLKLEFSKKKKKGKLPKEARQALLDWWNVHYKLPYPTVSHKHTNHNYNYIFN